MENQEIDTIQLNDKELIFLCSLIEGDKIIGIEDPFLVHTHEELYQDFETIEEDLKNRDLLKFSDDGKITIDDKVLAVVNTCCNSVAHVLIDKHGSSANGRVVFYATLHALVMATIPDTSKQDIFLKFISTTELLRKELLTIIPENLSDDNEESMLIATISISDFEKALSGNEADINSIKSVFEASGIHKEQSQVLVDILSKPEGKSSMMSLGPDKEDQLNGYGVLIFEAIDKNLLTIVSEDSDNVNIYNYCKPSVDLALDKVLKVISNTFLYENDQIKDFVSQLLSSLG